MSPPSDGARPICWLLIRQSDNKIVGRADVMPTTNWVDTAAMNDEAYVPVYTAADYDALWAEVERYRMAMNTGAVNEWHERLSALTARAEAAEAKALVLFNLVLDALPALKAYAEKNPLWRPLNGDAQPQDPNGVHDVIKRCAALNEGDGE